MKTILIFLAIAVSSSAYAEDNFLKMLSSLEGRQKDEMFDFKVQYSKAIIKNDSLIFNLEMKHQEELGSYTLTATASIPLKTLKKSKLQFQTNFGIGKNTVLVVAFPEKIARLFIDGKIEIINENKEKTTQPLPPEQNDFIFYFLNVEQGKKFENELKGFIKSIR
jgi:hypothetical protein